MQEVTNEVLRGGLLGWRAQWPSFFERAYHLANPQHLHGEDEGSSAS